MVTRFYTPADKRLPTELRRIQRSLADVQSPTGTERDRVLMRLQETVEKLEDAAKVFTNSTGAMHTGASWMPAPPSVEASSLSRKFRVTVTGGSTGGSTILTFSAPGFTRDRALGGTPDAVLARAMALGGASDAGTAQRSWIVMMPGPGPYTFTAQAHPTDGFATAVGLQIDVQPVL
ncbi:hypothetical protein [Leucobacter massiliensis]|uniref:Uncharacterized protein n=1 Tax=Leucobacter massiliensis TaxID=1686285 RepID=A0A2S9QMV6_9MICO|nr:hypothetical protein [Leucobacter massiliensis]PRI10912.1 hypothetical protein B4915_08485 [Leucobacter massiliensis]